MEPLCLIWCTVFVQVWIRQIIICYGLPYLDLRICSFTRRSLNIITMSGKKTGSQERSRDLTLMLWIKMGLTKLKSSWRIIKKRMQKWLWLRVRIWWMGLSLSLLRITSSWWGNGRCMSLCGILTSWLPRCSSGNRLELKV
jgi:hypothetical protein